VNIDAEAATSERAVASAEAVVAAYSANRQARLRGEIERAARVVDTELARIERTLASETLGAAALQQEYGRLLAVRSGLFRASANVDQAVTVVRPPVLAGSGLPPLVRDAGLGVLLGALTGAGALMAANQLRRRVRSREDLSSAGLPILHPDLELYAGTMADFTGQSPEAAALRLLAAQLVRPGGGGGLVLLGATSGVGTSFVAATMAVCLSERSDVLLVLAADVVEQQDGSAAQELGVDEGERGLTTLPHRCLTAEDVRTWAVDSAVPGVSVLPKGSGHSDAAVLRRLWQNGLLEACLATGLTVVVDAPALSESTTTIDLAARAGGAALVVGRGVTTRREVDMVRQMFARQEISLLGAIVNQPDSRSSRPPATPQPAPARPEPGRTAPEPTPSRSGHGADAGAGASALDRLRSRVTP
jgi:Mrp family chromosome partitioning ATPase